MKGSLSALLARRTRTMKLCSPGTRARLGALGVGRVRILRAVKSTSGHPLERSEDEGEGGRGAARPSFLLAKAARSECAPSMRAMKDSLAVPLSAW